MSNQLSMQQNIETNNLNLPNSSVRPFVKWAGGKRQLLPKLIENLPPRFNSYWEPMIGAGALFFNLQPAKAFIGDTNEQLIECYQTLQKNVDSLITDLATHLYESDYYYSLRDADRHPEFQDWSVVKRSSRFIYLNRTCFNGLYRVNSKGQFNVPIGRYKNPKICDAPNLHLVATALQNTTIGLASFEQIRSEVKRGDFVYFDPPYAPLNATSNFTQYTKEPFGEAMQVALRDFCSELDRKGVYFLLSNSSAPLIYDLYKGFCLTEVAATRAINATASKRGAVKELLVKNY